MAAKFGLVTHSAKAQPVEFTSQSTCDRTAERGLTDSRRADEKNDRALRIGPQFDDRQRFQNAFLNVFEAIVVFVEDLSGLVEVELFFARFSPRQFEDVFEICADDVIIGCRLRQLLHSLEFAFGFFADIVGQIGFFEPFAKLLRPRPVRRDSSSPSSFWIAFICWRRT